MRIIFTYGYTIHNLKNRCTFNASFAKLLARFLLPNNTVTVNLSQKFLPYGLLKSGPLKTQSVSNKAQFVKDLWKHDPFLICHTPILGKAFSYEIAFSLINTSLKENLSQCRYILMTYFFFKKNVIGTKDETVLILLSCWIYSKIYFNKDLR